MLIMSTLLCTYSSKISKPASIFLSSLLFGIGGFKEKRTNKNTKRIDAYPWKTADSFCQEATKRSRNEAKRLRVYDISESFLTGYCSQINFRATEISIYKKAQPIASDNRYLR